MQKRKVQVLEQKLESAYGKGSKLLLKAGGDNFALGEGMGKHNQGILNPVKNTLLHHLRTTRGFDKKNIGDLRFSLGRSDLPNHRSKVI